jgi:molybdopterin molybdotransferase
MEEHRCMEQLPPPSPQASPFFDVRMRGFRDRVHVETVIGMVDDHSPPLPAETVPLTEAFGRVLASPLCAEVAVPGFNRAAMDGYAVRAEETFGATAYNPLSLTVVGQVLPGQPFAGVVESGQAVRIMTGAPMPDGADAVVPAEYAQEVGSIVRITEAVPPARHVSRVGEDIAPGRQLFAAGRVLRPQDLGLLASVGIGTVPVVRRPTVAVIITGDELLPPGSKPSGYQIVDSNSPMLAALVQRDGGQVRLLPIVPDQPEAIRQAMQTASAEADVLLISGGSSVGREDHAPRLLAEMGRLLVHGVALRPASPTGLGQLGAALVFLLPGNPVSCLCAYDLFAGRAIRRLAGLSGDWPYLRVPARLSSKISSALGRTDYVRLRWVGPATTAEAVGAVEPLAISGASILSTTTIADGFTLVDAACEGYPVGATIEVYLYDRVFANLPRSPQ